MIRPMLIGIYGVGGCWIAFGLIFFSRGRPKGGGHEKADKFSRVGLVLQSLSYSVAWAVRRPFASAFLGRSRLEAQVEAAVAIAMAACSVWLFWRALRTLGKNWALVARVTEGHQLVRSGPYAVVRNPIYTGMFGMLLATALTNSHWIGALVAIFVFHVGTVVRVRSEERLLAEQFGSEFEDYKKQVPAYLPGVRF